MSIHFRFPSSIRNLLLSAAVAVPLLVVPSQKADAGVFVSVGFAPPALPVYVQPPLPAPGYLWTPGYWAYGEAGYYWVPGVWVQPPSVGLLWTPGYWGFAGGLYGWHGGYWGLHVGFYGGVNYGFGFGGIGFCGGEWRGGVFAYNHAVANFGSVHVNNFYEDRTVVNRTTIVNNNHTSFNGGAGGIQARATADEMRAANEHHIEPTASQTEHQNFAAKDRSQLASVNHGRPATMASSNVNSYHQVAQQHAQSQPISAADRAAGDRGGSAARSGERAASGVRSGQQSNTSRNEARAGQQSRQQSQPRAEQRAQQAHTASAANRQPQASRTQARSSQPARAQQHNSAPRAAASKPHGGRSGGGGRGGRKR